MTKTGPEIRHDSKARMKRYRAQMIEKGYISTTVFLSKEHRAELKRLGDEHRLTRAEAAEHIFKIYLQSNDKDVTRIHNIDADHQAKTIATIEALEARIKALEEKDSNQAEKIEDPVSAVEDVHLQNDFNGKDATQTDNTNEKRQIEPPATPEPTEKQLSEEQKNLFGEQDPEPKQEPKTALSLDMSTMPDCKSKKYYEKPKYRQWVISQIDRLKKAGLGSKKIGDLFNDAEKLTVSGQRFGRSTAGAFYNNDLKNKGQKGDKDLRKPAPIF